MVFLFECSNPFRKTWKLEKIGPLRRFIWGWFSVAYISAGFNDVWRAMREDEREECAKVCDDIASDRWALYKGRAPYTGREDGRADPCTQGENIGADACADAIRARSNVGNKAHAPACRVD